MTTRQSLTITDLEVIANTLSHDARWLLRIRKELMELADEGSHEQEAHEVRKRLRAILIPPDDMDEAETQPARNAMPDPFQTPHPSPCVCVKCCEERSAAAASHPEYCGCDECCAARDDYF